nr:DUF5642 family protein [Mycobacterium sp. 1245111.1]
MWAPAAVLLLIAGCGQPVERAPTPSASATSRHIDPANIRRVRRDLPPGYEAAPVADVPAPSGIWGLGGTGVATPARCAPLADPGGGHGRRAQGISGSGPGGTLHAVVVAGAVALDPSLVAQCRQWDIAGRRASARVHLVDAPRIDGADTVGMTADILTSVEGGNEIASRASNFTAYLGDYYAFTTVVSDPGSPNAALTPQFAADLLVKTVSAVRG